MIRRLLIACAIALSVAGCKLGPGSGLFGLNVDNPVSSVDLATVESSYGIALSAAVAYRRLPLCKVGNLESVTHVCARRSVIVKLQQADRTAQNALTGAREFIVTYPKLNPAAYIDLARRAVSAFKATVPLQAGG